MPFDINDDCPPWAEELIEELLKVEIGLGNIPPDATFASQNASELHARLYGTRRNDHSEEVRSEKLFAAISIKLHQEGFEAPAIANFFNARINYLGGPMYCDEGEVQDALDNY